MKALKANELDFYAKYLVDPEKERKKRVMLFYITPAVVLVGGLAFNIFSLISEKKLLELEIEDQQMSINQDGLMESYVHSLDASATLSLLDAEVSGMELFDKVKATYPDFGSEEVYRILECTPPGVTVTQMNFIPSQGIVSLNAAFHDVTMIPDYIETLKSTGMFETTEYSGYAGNKADEEKKGLSAYDYYISVNMKVVPPETDFDIAEYFSPGEIPAEESNTEDTEDTEE